MTSDILAPARTAFVWTWLPDATDPVVAGRIDLVDGIYQFAYGRSYLDRGDAIPLFLPDLPLRRGLQVPRAPHAIAPVLRDGAPDFWGRRVIVNRLTSARGAAVDVDALDELNYMLHSGSDRIGALDFQESATRYVPRLTGEATLEQLMNAAALVERGARLPLELDEAIRHGTSIGGARPKAQVEGPDRKMIAKFSASNDQHNVIKGEYLAMRLGAGAGLNVARVDLAEVAGRDVLLVTRFDRMATAAGWTRRAMVSGLTLLDLPEHEARYASYQDLATRLRHDGKAPGRDLRELFSRMCFNILIGNTDDHARNHAAFWDGRQVELTPAYDLDPRPRRSYEANQAMAISGTARQSRLALAVEAAPAFHLTRDIAEEIIRHQVEAIRDIYPGLARDIGLSAIDDRILRDGALLQPYAFEGLGGRLSGFSPALR
ncbi:type II toxin-antitoxin system HipA family toxin [Chachezhania sediminis]|uniref:type II toxin-antitoxin system HipA family toxin n=1 Tax=Chachezhania sediminis TaxID=2599291 RepID=UPI00131CC8B3|nr:type II toxin-antitoxin system HipA family toxin [Chachezhania sediminis]